MFRPVLVVGDPILAKEVMVNQFQNFPDHRFRGDSIKQIGGKMLFTLRHDDWRRVRAIVSPSFSTAKLKALIETMNGAVSTLISNVEKAVKNNQTVDMKIYLCSLTLDIISSCAFGVKIDSLQDPNNSIVDNSNKLFANNISWLSLFAFMSPSLAPVGSALGISIFDVKALKYFQFLIYELIQKRVQLLSSSSQSTSSRKDFIQLLMEGEIRANEYSDSRRKPF
ncbi:cytochrome P450 monooxygenase-like protein [Dinothrombium tinctorium]|uniref:Cytochrome P450 monooxygenase-like protein n=1 Tax=Dinothrombium tinctorium TaxID=1965070 RepID=A0A3S3RIX6_9ACAR|nr:cytochrome P450 monooxygenase-like protein [Dinothrombium tinctorium]